MNNAILAKNLLIQKQIEGISAEFYKNGIKTALLKGAALVLAFPGYAKQRNMQDIDMLVLPKDFSRARGALSSLGYLSLEEDPYAMQNSSLTAAVDLTDNIWYLDKKENEAVFNNSLKFSLRGFNGCMSYLKPEDFYIHVLAHAALHHVYEEKKWKDDVSLIMDNWGKIINWSEVENKLKSYGFSKALNAYLSPELSGDSLYLRMLRSTDNPYKGYVARVMFLPLRKKAAYVWSALFPSKEFLFNRYCLKSRYETLVYFFLRPLLLIKNMALFAKHLMFENPNIRRGQ